MIRQNITAESRQTIQIWVGFTKTLHMYFSAWLQLYKQISRITLATPKKKHSRKCYTQHWDEERERMMEREQIKTISCSCVRVWHKSNSIRAMKYKAHSKSKWKKNVCVKIGEMWCMLMIVSFVNAWLTMKLNAQNKEHFRLLYSSNNLYIYRCKSKNASCNVISQIQRRKISLYRKNGGKNTCR